MKEYNVVKSNFPLDIATQKSSKLKLLARSYNLEIMEQVIYKDKNFVIYPADNPDNFEFFYIISGTVINLDTNEKLEPGDSIHFTALKTTMNFKATTEVKVLYIINDSIFHVLSDEMKEIVEITNKVHEKDQYTREHGARVQQLSYSIAQEMRIKGEMLERVMFASLFHDLGKLEIPYDILNKPGKLTNEEYEIIKTHSYHGSKIIKRLYFKDLEQIVLQHHERHDGSGYPNGLKGDEILLEAAIIAVADTYDAMTSDRPYRKALPASVAIKELKDYRGKHYREDVVDAFLKVIEND